MANGFISRLFTRVFATSLVREAYAGILGREPDAAGLRAHVLRVRRTGQLAPVLDEIAHSGEARAGAWKAGVESVARQLHVAVRGEEPSLEVLSDWALKLQDSAAIQSVVETMASGPTHWQHVLERNGDAVVSTLFRSLLGRQVEGAEFRVARDRLGVQGGFDNLLNDLEVSTEHQMRILRRTGAVTEPEARTALLRSAYVGILGRVPDAEGLAAYSDALQRYGEAAPVLEEIAFSDEAWVRILRGRAASVASQICRGLQMEDGDPELVNTLAEALRQNPDLGVAFSAFADSVAIRRKQARRDAETIVAAAYQGLLWRDAEPQEIEMYAVPLGDAGDMAGFLSEIGQSEEHLAGLRERGKGLAPYRSSHPIDGLIDPELIVTATFQGLLGREPEPDTKAAYTLMLRENGDLSSFIAEVGRSVEHRKRLLLNRV